MTNVDEINRLTARGLNFITAMAVIEGKLDETVEVDRAREKRKVNTWCKGRKNIPDSMTPVWDCDPANFYLAFDGDDPSEHRSMDFVLIHADVAEVDGMLTYAASRDRDPWHRHFKRKSCGIAYRWLHGRGVTPPVLCEFQGHVHIVGGMHRFHLAKHYSVVRMPFLIRRNELAAFLALITSAAEVSKSRSC